VGDYFLVFANTAVLLFTSLIIGLTLVGIRPSSFLYKCALFSGLTALCRLFLEQINGWSLVSVAVYLILLLLLLSKTSLPCLQLIIALLLGCAYQLAVVYLLELNMMELMLEQSGVASDAIMEALFRIFIMMNNIWIVILCYQKEPVLFPKRLFFRHTQSDRSVDMYQSYLIFTVLLLVLLNVFLFFTYAERHTFSNMYRVFVTGWALCMCGLMLYCLRRIFIYKMEKLQNYLEQQYQQDIRSFLEIVRLQRHDFNFHLSAVDGLIQSGQYEASRKYMADMVYRASSMNELLTLYHPATSALLHTQQMYAKQQDIDIRYHIFDNLRKLPCSLYHFNTILGNLIQNAMEATADAKKEARLIEVEIAKELEQIVLQVTNPIGSEIELDQLFTSGFSTKQAHEGIGLSGTEHIITSYHGVIYPVIADEKLSIHVRMPVEQNR